MEGGPKKSNPILEEPESPSDAQKTNFIESYGDMDYDMNDSEEEEELFDTVCAICDNGGEILCCMGPCLRSFHPFREAGTESKCKSLGMTEAQVDAIQNFFCLNCKYKKHQCFICGKLGSSNKKGGTEVFSCISATCGRFYHPKCVSEKLAIGSEADDLEKNIAKGEQFLCPIHRCVICNQREDKRVKDLQFAICRRCPKSYHRKCLPKSISFKAVSEDEPIRAWDGLIPNRILIYCRKHKIDSYLETPIRNHLVFPDSAIDNRVKRYENAYSKGVVKSSSLEHYFNGKQQIILESSQKKENEKRKLDFKNLITVKSNVASVLSNKLLGEKEKSSSRRKDEKHIVQKKKFKSSIIEMRRFATQEMKLKKEFKSSIIEMRRFATQEMKSKKEFKSSIIEMKMFTTQETKAKVFGHGKVRNSVPSSSKIVDKKIDRTPIFPDNEIRDPVLEIIENATAGLTLNDIKANHQNPSSYSQPKGHRSLEKVITQGKVEGAVEAVKSAWRNIQEGCSIDDAIAVCEPEMLDQIKRWKAKLRAYLGPFLHGNRYTSYGRHFTKEGKLQEIVARLHCYVQEGDMIVDFCCGANDFSRLMSAKLHETGKRCFYKNFDLFQSPDPFNFERRDFLTVRREELMDGSKLIMGLNPPFGEKANILIAKVLEFKPKLIVLTVPKETKRLDVVGGYDLIWEDTELLAGKSYFIPGATSLEDDELDQWNNVAPPLYLWSHPDFTEPHNEIAVQKGHFW